MRYLYRHILFLLLLNLTVQAQNSQYDVDRLSFNTREFNEFSPVLYRDGLILCANYNTNALVRYQTPQRLPLYNLYYAYKKDSLSWKKPVLLTPYMMQNMNIGPATIHPTTGEIIFSRNIRSSKKLGNNLKDDNKLGLYTASCQGENCSEPQPFRFNNEAYDITHPSISKDGKALYFASNMPGGFGNMDIYVSYYKNGTWTDPENVGATINTNGNDMFPFIHENGRLYFASDKHESIGKLDVFYAVLVNNQWLQPVHLPQPLNSRADDFAYISFTNDQEGYFSSNRKKSDDIYRFTIHVPEFDECPKMKKKSYCVKVFEEGSMELESTTFKYEWDFGDGTKVRGTSARHCYDTTGTYIIQLNVIDTITGDVFLNEATYEYELSNPVQTYFISEDTVKVNKPLEFTADTRFLKNFKPQSYYWRFEDGEKDFRKSTRYVFEEPGTYKVWLGLTGTYPRSKDVVKYCNYREITVLP